MAKQLKEEVQDTFQENIAETVVLQIPKAFYQRLAIAATDRSSNVAPDKTMYFWRC